VSRHLRLFAYAVAVPAAFAVGACSWLTWPFHSLNLAAPLVALAVIGEELVVRQRQQKAAPALVLSAPAHIAAVIVLGPAPAALIAIIGLLAADGTRRESRPYLLLNASMFGAATLVSGLAYVAVGGTSSLTPASALAVSVMLVTRLSLTSLILSVGGAIATPNPLRVVAREVTADEARAVVGDTSLGVLLAFGMTSGHWVILPFLLPLVVAVYRSRSTYEQLKQETRAALDSVATIVDERHADTAAHTERVAEAVDRFAAALQLPQHQRAQLVLAARLHDIGKITVDAATLSKATKLSDAEIGTIRAHPRLSARLLRSFKFAEAIATLVELHHERFDGNGYYRVPGTSVPIESHVLIVADSFDAMTSRRPYRPALTTEEAVAELRDKAGTQFHPLIARAFAGILLHDDITADLAPGEVRALREAFGGMHPPAIPSLGRWVDFRSASVVLGAAALIAVSVYPSTLIAASTALIAAIMAAAAGLRYALSRRRSGAVAAALAPGPDQLTRMREAGLLRWVAWLGADVSGRYAVAGSFAAPARDVEAILSWASRRDDAASVDVGGDRVVITPRDEGGRRLAVAFATAADPHEHDIVDRLLQIAPPSDTARRGLSLVHARPSESSHLLHIDLQASERVRVAAGQLVSERVSADAADAIAASLRGTDVVAQLGPDEFVVILEAADQETAKRVAGRIAAAVGQVQVPARVDPVAPAVALVASESSQGQRLRRTAEQAMVAGPVAFTAPA
jgi:HD-GYP domain-containing protein (c-di-GMP phosphodiesterase class II)/GGDEF domain-containing protein